MISIPMKVNGAQQAIAQGMPQTDTMIVAMRRDLTKGAKHIAAAKIRWLHCHAVRRSGLWFWNRVTRGPKPGGGRGVNGRLLAEDSGASTSQGSVTEAMNVMMENMTRDREPTRPTSPRVSVEALAFVSG